ncbi:hypothetical protein [Actinopolyspora mortivallis]|uniref:hypothetical protein n=1 Tax=Actinopolyspora mortivallis TaxID=33906 RepID=UPI0005254D8F|nr:hypothetical protein [Actinopolyspora mortivallis]
MVTRSTETGRVQVRCTTVESGGRESFVLRRSGDNLRIDTPTVFHRTRWTVEQARKLRDVLDAALREVGQ